MENSLKQKNQTNKTTNQHMKKCKHKATNKTQTNKNDNEQVQPWK